MNRLLPVLILLTSCSLGSERGDVGSGATSEAAADSGSIGPDDDGAAGGLDSGASLAPAAWWRLGAELELGDPISSGEAYATNAVGGRLTLVSLDESESVRCSAEAEIERLTLLTNPEPEVYAWWLVVAGNWTGSCADLGVPVPVSTLQLGIGVLHPELRAVLGSVEAAAAGSERTLNGAYARFDAASPVYAFGLAGPAGAFGGVGDAAVEPPLAAGTWQVEPAYSFSAGDGW